MDNTAVFFRFSFKLIAGHALRRFRRPIGTDISENLSAVRKKLHEKHSETVQYVILCREYHRLLLSFKVEGRIQNCFRIVAVRPMIRPLTLSLEAGCDRIVTNALLDEIIGQIRISLDKVFNDAVHLNGEFPLLFLLRVRKPDGALLA